MTLTPFWVSFWDTPEHLKLFEYHGPWWVSGERGCWGDPGEVPEESVVAAVMAVDEAAAHEAIRKAYDDGSGPREWRFVTEKGHDWNPLSNASGRFNPAPWMKWPWPAPPQDKSEEKA